MKNLLLYFFLPTALLIGVSGAIGQDMKSGFRMLESGSYDEATIFFKNILKEHPYNKTAIICYGRAVGLNGNAQMALDLFNELDNTYPYDMEILLNKAEAYLWLKMPDQAKTTYYSVLSQDSLSFNALLGVANAFSMAHEHQSANKWIQRAIAVNPSSDQALLSQKFIRLAYANQLASEQQDFEKALKLVNQNLTIQSDDQESLTLKANIHIMSGDYALATQAFDGVKSHVDRLLGTSIAKHLEKKDDEALELAKKALVANNIRVMTHYISALLWNKELGAARAIADSLANSNPNTPEYIASQAEVAMYEADFIDGYERYNAYLIENPQSFKGNLGLADASHALGIDDQAYKYAQNTLKFHPGQQDAKAFIQRLNNLHSPNVIGSLVYGNSSDGSSFIGWSTGLEASVSPRTSISTNYSQKTYHTRQTKSENQSETITLGIKSQFGKRLRFDAQASKIDLIEDESDDNTRMIGEAMATIKMSKSQTTSLGIKSELQDFNSDLLSQNLKTNHLFIKNALNWKTSGFGMYSEYYYSSFSDGNSRQLLFNSFYKSIEKKGLKYGINYLAMKFEESRSLQYFSPTSFHQFEMFGDISIKHQSIPVELKVNSALGYQLMSNQNQISWRMKATIEKNAGRLKLNVFGAYSSIGTAQANGFSFFNCGATIKWQLSETPLFKVQ